VKQSRTGSSETKKWDLLNMKDFKRMDLNMLAMYCLRVAESPASSAWEIERARELKMEWALFIGNAKPPIPGLETKDDMDAYENDLKERMVGFLAELPMDRVPGSEPSSDRLALRAGAGLGK
jgi:hypothetical protein